MTLELLERAHTKSEDVAQNLNSSYQAQEAMCTVKKETECARKSTHLNNMHPISLCGSFFATLIFVTDIYSFMG